MQWNSDRLRCVGQTTVECRELQVSTRRQFEINGVVCGQTVAITEDLNGAPCRAATFLVDLDRQVFKPRQRFGSELGRQPPVPDGSREGICDFYPPMDRDHGSFRNDIGMHRLRPRRDLIREMPGQRHRCIEDDQ